MSDGRYQKVKKERELNIEISCRKVFVILLSVIGFLLFAHIMGLVTRLVFDHDTVYGLIPMFDLGDESNVPTLFSSLQLILASLILSTIGARRKSNGEDYVFWFALAAIFLFLAVDETAQVHEQIDIRIREAYEPTGILYFPWVIPYGIAVVVLVIAFSNFLLRLPKETMWLFIASGVIYVTGVIGFEMLGARHYEIHGPMNVVYAIIVTCEELLEMVGVALFIYALLAYISNQHRYLRCTIKH